MAFGKIVLESLPILFQGLKLTVEITCIALVFALIIGLVMGLFRISKNFILTQIATLYLNIIRGTPLLIQILFIYIGLPAAFQFRMTEFTAGVIAISINAGAYLMEIFRAGIESIDRGQTEAGRSLGFSYGQTMRLVILPQAVRRMIPAFVNQFIISLKDTSLLSVIGVQELTMQGQSIYAVNFKAAQILAAVGAMYFVIIFILTQLSMMLERRMARS